MKNLERGNWARSAQTIYWATCFFIGALYKQGLLKENIMHHCVQELFGDPSEPDSEKL